MRDRKISYGIHGDNWLASSRWIWQTEVLEWPEEKQIQKGMCNQGRALLQFQQTMHTLESRFPQIKQLRWPSSVALITVSRKQKKKWIHACSVSHSVSQLRGFLPLCTGTLNPELLCLWAFAAGPCNSIPGLRTHQKTRFLVNTKHKGPSVAINVEVDAVRLFAHRLLGG